MSDIDWKAKFERSVSDAIEAKAKASEKLREAQLELAQAKQKIKEQETELSKLRPVEAKLKASEKAREKELVECTLKISEANRWVGRGQRGVIEDVIVMLQERVKRLPAPLPTTDDLVG